MDMEKLRSRMKSAAIIGFVLAIIMTFFAGQGLEIGLWLVLFMQNWIGNTILGTILFTIFGK